MCWHWSQNLALHVTKLYTGDTSTYTTLHASSLATPHRMLTSSSSSAFPAMSLGFIFSFLGEGGVGGGGGGGGGGGAGGGFCLCDHKGSHISSSWMVHAGCSFVVAGIHAYRTWMSESFESVRWNAWMHRLDLCLYSHPKEFLGVESEPMLTSSEKSPLLEAQWRIKPVTLHHAGQRAQHTDWAILAHCVLTTDHNQTEFTFQRRRVVVCNRHDPKPYQNKISMCMKNWVIACFVCQVKMKCKRQMPNKSDNHFEL